MKKPQPPPTEKQIEVYSKFAKSRHPRRPHDVALEMGFNESAPIYDKITALMKKGYLERSGFGKNTFYHVTDKPIP